MSARSALLHQNRGNSHDKRRLRQNRCNSDAPARQARHLQRVPLECFTSLGTEPKKRLRERIVASEAYEFVLTEVRDRVGIVTMNRPEKLNALHGPQQAEMQHAIRAYDADPEIGAIILTGAGRVFCAGADISGWDAALDTESGSAGQLSQSDERPAGNENWPDLMADVKPIVVAYNGAAVGAGLTLTLGADFRVAAESARFSLRFPAMGVTPELQSSMIFPQLVGLQNSLDMMLSGKFVTAQEALEMGFIGEVVPDEELLDSAVARASQYAVMHPDVTRMVKKLVWQNAVETDGREVSRRELEVLRVAMAGPAHREAVKAFMEKRDPDFYKDV